MYINVGKSAEFGDVFGTGINEFLHKLPNAAVQFSPVTVRVTFLKLQHNIAMLYISAVFVVARCPSVRLSFTIVYSIPSAAYVVQLLSWSGNSIIVLSDNEQRQPIPRATPSAGAQNVGCCDLRLKSTFISEAR